MADHAPVQLVRLRAAATARRGVTLTARRGPTPATVETRTWQSVAYLLAVSLRAHLCLVRT